jgi:hypothetical protein
MQYEQIDDDNTEKTEGLRYRGLGAMLTVTFLALLAVTLTATRLGAAEKPEGFVSAESASDTLFERGNYTTYNRVRDVIVYDYFGYRNNYLAENETHVFNGFEWEEIGDQKRLGKETLNETFIVDCDIEAADLLMCSWDDHGEAYFASGGGSSQDCITLEWMVLKQEYPEEGDFWWEAYCIGDRK